MKTLVSNIVISSYCVSVLSASHVTKSLFKLIILVSVFLLSAACSQFPVEEQIAKFQQQASDLSLPEEQWEYREVSELPLSAGDRVRIRVEEGEAFSGVFEVSVDGSLHIPYLDAVKVAGLSVMLAQKELINTLVKQKMYQPGFNGVSINILHWTKIQVFVQGAVFKPGRVLLNDKLAVQKTYQQTQESGDNPVNRYLTAGLKGAGGIRPDSDLTRINIIRQGRRIIVDVSGMFSGFPVKDIPLIEGDRLVIPSVGKIQVELIRPSQITPPGFHIFMSNLSQPVTGNAQAAVSKSSSALPYGTRLLEGAVAANCMGGSWVNSSRKILHSSKNLLTGESQVKVFELDEMLENVTNLEGNPYLMPDDGLACFDSDATNVREVAKFLGDILDPVAIVKLLFFL